jgi:HSP20 family protein
MSIVHWNPWREFDDGPAAPAERGSRLFTVVTGTPGESLARSGWLPPVDITETAKAYRIELEIPAVAAGDVNVSVKDGVLTVSGERKSESDSESEEGRRHRVERRWGKFSRSFRLPENIDEDAIEARSRDGVLYLTVAKKEKAQPRRIQVTG